MKSIDEIKLKVILEEKEVPLTVEESREIKVLLRHHLEDDRTPAEIAMGMPAGLSEGQKFFWKQDNGYTSSAEDAFGFW